MTSPNPPATAEIRQRGKEELRSFKPDFETPVVPIMLILLGSYLLWFGVRYWRAQGNAAWPSTPIKSILQGKGLPPNQPADTADEKLSAFEQAGITSGSAVGGAGVGNVPPASGNAQKNQNIAKLLAHPYGWSPTQDPGQWDALVKLWDQESSWSTTAQNPSGAYGIPQALPASKLASAGANWKTSAQTQIKWGLSYIKARYGSPEAAWAHEQAWGWY